MQLDWEAMFRRYVADDAKTPYKVRPDRLTRAQAGHELFVYVLFMSVVFGVLAVATLSPALPHGATVGVPLYCLSVLATAVVLGFGKHTAAAAWCAAAPIAMLLYFLVWGFLPSHGPVERTILVVLVLAWLGYSWRVLAIARAWPELRDEPPASGRADD